MKAQILTMLELQDAMNTKVHADWRARNHSWYRAIWVECAELMDHFGWKWWKKQVPDREQVVLELVDIWHFGLSIVIANATNLDAAAEQIAGTLATAGEAADFKEDVERFALTTLSTRDFDVAGFGTLMRGMDLDFDELYRRYVGKNVLNFFRQDHGYKEGTYRKVWRGREDNEHLVEIVSVLDASAPDFQNALYQALEARYQA